MIPQEERDQIEKQIWQIERFAEKYARKLACSNEAWRTLVLLGEVRGHLSETEYLELIARELARGDEALLEKTLTDDQRQEAAQQTGEDTHTLHMSHEGWNLLKAEADKRGKLSIRAFLELCLREIANGQESVLKASKLRDRKIEEIAEEAEQLKDSRMQEALQLRTKIGLGPDDKILSPTVKERRRKQEQEKQG